MEEEQYLFLGHAEWVISKDLHFLVEVVIQGFVLGLKCFDELPFNVSF